MSDLAQASFERKIVKQIEYYFGDINMPKDKFLLQKIEEDDGWVSLECLLTFNRLKKIVHEAIAKSLRDNGSGLLEVNENNTKLRRVKPLPYKTEEAMLLAREKTVYCKGFPQDLKIDDIERFFEDKGKCIFIKMRRELNEEKTFKGSVFAEFNTKEEADAFLATKGLKYGETELTYMSKTDYYNSKKKKNGASSDDTKGTEEIVKIEENKSSGVIASSVVHFTGAGEQTSREDIRELFDGKAVVSVAWIDYKRGDGEGYVRFKNAGDGQKAIECVKDDTTGKVILRGDELTFRVLEGHEEETYWARIGSERGNQKRRGRKRPHQNNRGRRDRSFKGERRVKQESDHATPAKQVKTET